MTGKIETISVRNFGELLEAVEAFEIDSQISWFRGCRNGTHRLIPTLYRHPIKSDFSELMDLEREVSTRFVQRSLPFLDRSLTDDWDKLFLMQHYGTPTRLLDWSENPFVSIYFSLVSQTEYKDTNSAVWMLNPVAWNQAVLEHISFKGGVLDQSVPVLRSYAPGNTFSEIPTLPVMIYGSYNSPRIVAQRGGFSLFGQNTSSMDTVYESEKFPAGILKKIDIDHASIDEIRKSLFRKGFTESVIFPDLDGLAREIKRVFGF